MDPQRGVGHGIKNTFEIVGEKQVVDGVDLKTPPSGFRFGRLFPGLKPFRPTDASLALLGDAMSGAGVAEPRPQPGEPASPIPAGYTYFGQFVDHDITLDQSADLDDADLKLSDDQLTQARSPSLDLDSLYGDPLLGLQPPLTGDGARFAIGLTLPVTTLNVPEDDPVRLSHPNDLPRDAAGVAQIGDKRNDENLIVAQLHLAFLKFHNKVVDVLEARGDTAPENLLEAARAIVVRHYQWLVLNDFVRRFTDETVFQDVLGVADLGDATTLAPRPLAFGVTGFETPPMPLEFSVAAYRFGHSMVRDVYSWNRFFPNPGLGLPPGTLQLLFAFTELSGGLGHPDRVPPSPANGLPALPSNWIADWRRLFDFAEVPEVGANPEGVPLNMARSIDARLAGGLFTVPGVGNLAAKNLIRGAQRGLPSAQDLLKAFAAAQHHAGLVGEDRPGAFRAMTPEEIADLPPEARKAVREAEFDLKSPLWFYILKEAEHAGRQRLGPLGSRIVIETFLGLIRTSKASILNADHDAPGVLRLWSPAEDSDLRVGEAPITTLAHLLAFVGDVNPLG
jgi:hypothetical protein